MLRFVVSERGRPELPGIDLEGTIVIGSAPDANIRLPAAAARPEHVRIEGTAWRDLARGTAGEIGDGTAFEIGNYRVRVARAPTGVPASSPQRTESLARELMRGLLGEGAAPVISVVRGPNKGTRRQLPPPEAALVIGRGDDADWVILDEDLSRKHAEIERGWEGTLLRDLDSQNGTSVDGKRIANAIVLRDGMRIGLGNIELEFEDPAERHLRSSTKASVLSESAIRDEPAPPPVAKRSVVPAVIAAAIAVSALAALAYVLVS